MKIYIIVTILSSYVFHQVFSSFSVEELSRLEEDLLKDYKVSTRPSQQTNVLCALSLSNILELDIVEQTCSISAYLIAMWMDPRLEWNVSQYGGIDEIYLQFDQIWRPPLYLTNAAKEFRLLGDEVHQSSMPIYSNSLGRVFWNAPAYFVSRCEADVSNFPFDKHTCKFIISAWIFKNEQVSLRHLSQATPLGFRYEENSEWEITDSSNEYEATRLMGSLYQSLSFSITLERKPSYYVLYVIVPVVVFNIVGAVVFTVPSGSGEKLTFSLTMLLSTTVLMTIVGEKIPTSSMQVSKLGVYLVCSMTLNILEVIFTVIILQLYNAGQENTLIASWWQTLIRTLNKPLKSRISCQWKGTRNLVTVKPAMVTEEIANTIEENEGNEKLNIDNRQEELQYNYIQLSRKLDTICFGIFMILAVLLSLGFVLASATN